MIGPQDMMHQCFSADSALMRIKHTAWTQTAPTNKAHPLPLASHSRSMFVILQRVQNWLIAGIQGVFKHWRREILKRR